MNKFEMQRDIDNEENVAPKEPCPVCGGELDEIDGSCLEMDCDYQPYCEFCGGPTGSFLGDSVCLDSCDESLGDDDE